MLISGLYCGALIELLLCLQVRESRDADAVKKCLGAIEQCARTREGNLLELAVEAAKARSVNLNLDHLCQVSRAPILKST